MLEDRVKHRAGTLDEPLNMLCALTVNIRKEEQLLVSLDHETGEMDRTELILHFREIGHQRRQRVGERLGVGGTSDREINHEVILSHRTLLEISSHQGRPPT